MFTGTTHPVAKKAAGAICLTDFRASHAQETYILMLQALARFLHAGPALWPGVFLLYSQMTKTGFTF